MPKPAHTKRTRSAAPPPPPAQTVEVIDPRWLLKAGAVVVALALVCAYLTYCLLFWQGQWQFALQPSRSIGATPASQGFRFDRISFGPGESGTPELAGWWIPSEAAAGATALLLHTGTGNEADALGPARELHNAGLNVLLFDYRGFGSSAGAHPTEHTMEADTAAAFTYLTATRHLDPAQIVPVGIGVGASLAQQLCSAHHDIPACIFIDADGDIERRLSTDSRARLLPTSLLFHERFPLRVPLQSLATPKLFITHGVDTAPAFASAAANPKMTVEIPSPDADQTTQSIRRFLAQYVSTPIPALKP